MFFGGKQHNDNLVSTITANYFMAFTESSLCLTEICRWEMDIDALQLLAENQTQSPNQRPCPCLKCKRRLGGKRMVWESPHSLQDSTFPSFHGW